MTKEELETALNALKINGKSIFDDKDFIDQNKDNKSFIVLQIVRSRLLANDLPGQTICQLIIDDLDRQNYFTWAMAKFNKPLISEAVVSAQKQTVLPEGSPIKAFIDQALKNVEKLPNVQKLTYMPETKTKESSGLSKLWARFMKALANAWAAIKNFLSSFTKKPAAKPASTEPTHAHIEPPRKEPITPTLPPEPKLPEPATVSSITAIEQPVEEQPNAEEATARLERERAEQAAKEEAEKIQQEREKAEAEKQAKEKAEQERLEKEKTEQAEQEKIEREKAQQQQEKEKQEREKKESEKQAQAKERAEQGRLEKEKTEQEARQKQAQEEAQSKKAEKEKQDAEELKTAKEQAQVFITEAQTLLKDCSQYAGFGGAENIRASVNIIEMSDNTDEVNRMTNIIKDSIHSLKENRDKFAPSVAKAVEAIGLARHAISKINPKDVNDVQSVMNKLNELLATETLIPSIHLTSIQSDTDSLLRMIKSHVPEEPAAAVEEEAEEIVAPGLEEAAANPVAIEETAQGPEAPTPVDAKTAQNLRLQKKWENTDLTQLYQTEDGSNDPLLIYQIRTKNIPMIKWILQKDIRTLLVSHRVSGMTPIMCAVKSPNILRGILTTLNASKNITPELKKKIYMAKDKNGKSFEEHLKEHLTAASIDKGLADEIGKFRSTANTKYNDSALISVVKIGRIHMVKLLLARNPKQLLDASEDSKKTPLMYAAKLDNQDILLEMLKVLNTPQKFTVEEKKKLIRAADTNGKSFVEHLKEKHPNYKGLNPLVGNELIKFLSIIDPNAGATPPPALATPASQAPDATPPPEGARPVTFTGTGGGPAVAPPSPQVEAEKENSDKDKKP